MQSVTLEDGKWSEFKGRECVAELVRTETPFPGAARLPGLPLAWWTQGAWSSVVGW